MYKIKKTTGTASLPLIYGKVQMLLDEIPQNRI